MTANERHDLTTRHESVYTATLLYKQLLLDAIAELMASASLEPADYVLLQQWQLLRRDCERTLASLDRLTALEGRRCS